MHINKIMTSSFLQLVIVAGVFAKPDTKCGTQEALELFRQGLKLPRPASGPKYVYSTHFIVHFDTTGSNATTRAYAESTSKYAEYSWSKQCDTLIWAEPPPDGSGPDNRYDIYISNLPGYLGVTHSEYLYSNPYPNGATSYIEVDNNITPWGLLQVTVAHEFNHASQLRYSYLEGVWFMENCATWMEDVCYDNVNDYINYLLYSTPNPLDNPHLSITTTTELYEYAGCLWPMLLHEGFNIACPRQAWERMGTISGENTLSGIDYALSNYYGSNLAGALKKYGIWRYFTGTRSDPTYHFSESNLLPTATLLATHSSYPASGNQGSYPPSGPGGTDLIRFNPGSGALNISFDGQDGYNWSAHVIGYRVPAQSIEQEITLNAQGYGTTTLSWTGNSHIALVPIVTHWSGSANNLNFTYSANQQALIDVGLTQILAPTGTIDSGTIVNPQARVKNYGTNPASFSTIFRIGSFYTNTQNVNNLNPGDSISVNFSSCTLRLRGPHTTRCTTALTGDQNPTNDALNSSVTVRVIDVACIAILSPTGTIDSGTFVTPITQLKNNGTQSATCSLTFRIGTFYTNTRTKTLGAGITDTAGFLPWLANQIGNHTTRCTIALTSDMVPANNMDTGSVTVQVGVIPDVGVTQIIAPTNTVDSGTTITPQTMVKNFGNTPQTFPVTFQIGTFYTNTQSVNNLLPGESTLVSFNDWGASLRGNFTTRCTTALTGDINPANNLLTGSVTVHVQDVGVTGIIVPIGTIDSGEIVIPQAKVKNFGTTTASFSVLFRVGAFYTDTQPVTNLLAGDSLILNFDPCTLSLVGSQVTICTTAFAQDLNPNNDSKEGSIIVFTTDVGVVRIISPTGTVGAGTVITPSAAIANFGIHPETFPVYFRILTNTDTVYYDDTIITVEPRNDSVITFAQWNSLPGSYRALVKTILANDQIPENDNMTNNFLVSEIGWQRLADVPATPSGKYPKNGSCITGLGDKVYLLKANNTSDFYCYQPNFWTQLTSLPLGSKETGNGKNPKKGAAITSYNDKVYVLRGNNTSGFWEYSTTGWRPLENIPTGAKKPKGGSGLTYVNKGDTGCIFAMKGSKTAEFYLYYIDDHRWQQVTSPPTGASGKIGYKTGSCLTYDGDSFVYVLKGNYGDFFRYNVLNNTWNELRRYDPAVFLNRENRKKKVKDGAGLVYLNGSIYLMKGGNTCEIWKYNITGNTWVQMNPANIWDIPNPTGKKVKSGGSLCVLNNTFYALKGNNTPEFYQHLAPATDFVPRLTSEGVISNKLDNNWVISLIPNPAQNIVNVNFNLPNPEIVLFQLFDIGGSVIKSYPLKPFYGKNSIRLDVRNLPSGVYILNFRIGRTKLTKKLILQR